MDGSAGCVRLDPPPAAKRRVPPPPAAAEAAERAAESTVRAAGHHPRRRPGRGARSTSPTRPSSTGSTPRSGDGVGLVRTEFLFHGRRAAGRRAAGRAWQPAIVAWAQGRPVTIRTPRRRRRQADPRPDGRSTARATPFLGNPRHPVVAGPPRAVPDPAARPGPGGGAWPAQDHDPDGDRAGRAGRRAPDAGRGRGRAGRRPASRPGAHRSRMMVEVPAAALAVDRFAADFLSIGSNDLTQYVTAAARDVPARWRISPTSATPPCCA